MRSIVRQSAFPLALTLTLTLATSAKAQDTRFASARETRLAERLDAPTRDAVVAIVDEARTRRLPTEPLVDKALEGASKRAPSDRIVAVVRSLADDLARSRAALGPDASDAEVTAGANALRAGVDAEALRRVYRGRGKATSVVALGVLQQFIVLGAAADSSLDAIVAMQQAGMGDDELLELRRTVTREVAVGASPTRAVTEISNGFIGAARDGARRPKPKP